MHENTRFSKVTHTKAEKLICVFRINPAVKFVSYCYLCLPEVSAEDCDLINILDMSLLLLIGPSYTES